jgi:diguanylate cyclase (GGDEF)-like protein
MSTAPEADRLRSIIAVAGEIAATRPEPDAILELVAERAGALTGAERGVVELDGEPPERVSQESARSVLSAPLRGRGRTLGALKVLSPEPDAFDDGDRETLELLSGLAAAHLANAQTRHDREDPVTGLPGRDAFEAALRGEVARASRYGLRLSLAVLAVDKLRRLGDVHGRGTVDSVLMRVAGVLRDFRACDTAFRVGDGEFALLLPNTPCDAARSAAERVALEVGACGLPAGRVSVSVGVAEAGSADPPGLLGAARADLARERRRRRGLRAA